MRPDETVSLDPVDLYDLRDVQAVLDDLTAYSKRVDGVARRRNAALQFATALPPGCPPNRKHAFVARMNGRPVGLLDLVGDHPSPGTTFVGLLAVREDQQASGLGRAIFVEAERFAREHLRAKVVRLAVVETNPVRGFWAKMGFRPTGEAKPHVGEAVTTCVVMMEKTVAS